MRVPPLPAEQWDDDKVRAVIDMACSPDRRAPGASGNAIATLVQHPDLAGAYLPFSAYLLTGSTLPPALRELAILRLAHRTSCEYEWSHHLPMGRRAGLTDEDVTAASGADVTAASGADVTAASGADVTAASGADVTAASGADVTAASGAETDSEQHHLVIAAVDDLIDHAMISEQTWQGLAGFLERRQLMDLVFTVGGYLTLAMGLNSFGVQPESDEWREDAHRS
ncbi:carboxymuconolactone decarboxylase family protein [Mycolicibacterium vaccae]|uniref:carboxymuconolactone decarboxylase family protein n=1 Tax=Mycolicibacterium vaccae TaxID=1810 RepID=UPI003CE77CF1